MDRVVRSGGRDKTENKFRLATPRTSESLSVYGLSIDVFLFCGLSPLIQKTLS